MLAYTSKKSYLGPLGFDTLSFYTNDEIKYTGFTPSEFEILCLGKFIQKLNENFFSTEPSSLIVSKINGIYFGDLKVFNGLKMIYANSEGGDLKYVLKDLERKIYM